MRAGTRSRRPDGACRPLRTGHRTRRTASATKHGGRAALHPRVHLRERALARGAGAGLLWAPLRKPHENALDPHWLRRGSVTDVEHPELGRSFRYATQQVDATATGWSRPARAAASTKTPTRSTAPSTRGAPASAPRPRRRTPVSASPRGKPFALDGIRVLDFTWFLASAGGTRFLPRSARNASKSS